MSQENVDLYYRAVDAIDRHDLSALLALMDDEVDAVPRIVAMEGGLQGHEGIRRWWDEWFATFPDYSIEVVEARDVGDVVIASLRTSGRGASRTVPAVGPPGAGVLSLSVIRRSDTTWTWPV